MGFGFYSFCAEDAGFKIQVRGTGLGRCLGIRTEGLRFWVEGVLVIRVEGERVAVLASKVYTPCDCCFEQGL